MRFSGNYSGISKRGELSQCEKLLEAHLFYEPISLLNVTKTQKTSRDSFEVRKTSPGAAGFCSASSRVPTTKNEITIQRYNSQFGWNAQSKTFCCLLLAQIH